MIKYSGLGILLLLLIETGCQKVPNKPITPAVPLNTLICKVNGVTWEPGKDSLGKQMVAALFDGIDNDSVRLGFYIYAQKGTVNNIESIMLHIDTLQNKLSISTYTQHISFNFTDAKSNFFGCLYIGQNASVGTITINGFDLSASTFFGDFSFKGQNIYTKEFVNVTEGHFNLHYSVQK